MNSSKLLKFVLFGFLAVLSVSAIAEENVLITYTSGIYTVHEVVTDARENELIELAKKEPKLYLRKLLDYNMEKLSAVYKNALDSTIDSEHREALQKSQKAWLQFYETDSLVANWNDKGGSLALSAKLEQQIYQIRMRIYQLKVPFLQGWNPVPQVLETRAVRTLQNNAKHHKPDRAGELED